MRLILLLSLTALLGLATQSPAGTDPISARNRGPYDLLMAQDLSASNRAFLEAECDAKADASEGQCADAILDLSRYLVHWTLKARLGKQASGSAGSQAFYRLLLTLRRVREIGSPERELKIYLSLIPQLPRLNTVSAIDAEVRQLRSQLPGRDANPYALLTPAPSCEIALNRAAMESKIKTLAPGGEVISTELDTLLSVLVQRLDASGAKLNLGKPTQVIEDAFLAMLITSTGTRIAQALAARINRDLVVYRTPRVEEWSRSMIRQQEAVTTATEYLAPEVSKPYPHQTILIDPLLPLGAFSSTFVHEATHATDELGHERIKQSLDALHQRQRLDEEKSQLELKRSQLVRELKSNKLSATQADEKRKMLLQLTKQLAVYPGAIASASAFHQKLLNPEKLRSERLAYRTAEAFRAELARLAPHCYPALLQYLDQNQLFNSSPATDEIIIDAYRLKREYLPGYFQR